jgi:hypothetical protein
MTYLAMVTGATLLLISFLVINAFSLLVREAQHKRHKAAWEASHRFLTQAQVEVDNVNRLLDRAQGLGIGEAVEAGRELDAQMRSTISEGIHLAGVLAKVKDDIAALVAARKVQRIDEVKDLAHWDELCNSLQQWTESYPAWMFHNDDQERGES